MVLLVSVNQEVINILSFKGIQIDMTFGLFIFTEDLNSSFLCSCPLLTSPWKIEDKTKDRETQSNPVKAVDTFYTPDNSLRVYQLQDSYICNYKMYASTNPPFMFNRVHNGIAKKMCLYIHKARFIMICLQQFKNLHSEHIGRTLTIFQGC